MHFLFLFLLSMACFGDWYLPGSRPEGRIAEQSATPSCRAAVGSALRAIKTSQGLDFKVEEPDVDTLFASAHLEKTYRRDGKSFHFYFGIAKDPTCALHMYRTKTPTDAGYGVEGRDLREPLKGCTCE
jgi:hypothetical protein